MNVLKVFARGPTGRSHPSSANWNRFYSPTEPTVHSRDVP
jgi:hypothetical protein